jgi:hypothetical protein
MERSESLLQEKVRLYLNNCYNYKINHEFNCSILPHHPKSNRCLPFDNEVYELKLLIEVNGVAHYKIDTFTHRAAKQHKTSVEYEFHKRKLYDRYKKYVAFCNGFYYLEIPYWTENDESYKKLIDDKIKEIKAIQESKQIAV